MFLCAIGCEIWSKKTRVPGLADSDIPMILCSLVLPQYQSVMDRCATQLSVTKNESVEAGSLKF